MKTIFKHAFFALVAISFAACAKKEEKVVITASKTMDSEQLAQAGEQLVSPYTFMLADTVLAMALEKDPNNQRAQFYRTVLKPVMTLKGIHTRVKPLARSHGDIAKYERAINDVPNSAIKDFLSSGPEDVTTADELQSVLIKYRDALYDLYTYLKVNQKAGLVLNLNATLFQKQIWNNQNEYCNVVGATAGQGDLRVECDYSEIAQRRIGEADAIAMRQMIAGKYLYLLLYTSYSVSGIEDLVKEASQSQAMTSEQLFARLRDLPGAGKLRGDNKLKLLRTLGADFHSAWKAFTTSQNRLCAPRQYGRQSLRRKGFLLEQGICITADSESEKNMALLAQVLKGENIQLDLKFPDGSVRATTMNYNVIIDSPVSDLRKLYPTQFNGCDKPVQFPDATMGGLFPNGDAPLSIDKVCNQ